MKINTERIRTALKVCGWSLTCTVVTVCILRFFGDCIAANAYKYTFSGNEVESSVAANEADRGVSGGLPTELAENAAADAAKSETDSSVSYESTVTENPEATAVNLSAISGKYKNFGGTAVINNTDYDVSELLYADYVKPQIDKSLPSVLIYHTHTSEEYYGGGTVAEVGAAMAEEFERLGYQTIHITEFYDREQFSGAYSRSVKGVEAALEKYPSVKLCFDIHRDAISGNDGTVYRPLTTVENRSTAQVMLVCGTDSKGLSHPSWRENFKFALDISRTMGKEYGALSRPVNLRRDRFNTHVTRYTVLMEIGSNANTLDEAKNAAIYTARAVVDTVER